VPYPACRKCFFANSGSEANEGALKLVRFYGHKRGNPEAQTIVMERACMAETLATLAATRQRRKGAPWLSIRLPTGLSACPTTTSVRSSARGRAGQSRASSVARGVAKAKAACTWPIASTCAPCAPYANQRGWLLMVDEVQSRHRPHRPMVRLPMGRYPA